MHGVCDPELQASGQVWGGVVDQVDTYFSE